MLLKNIMPAGNLTVLDLGCGIGSAGDLFSPNKNYQFTGVDIYKPYLKICQKKGNYRELIQADITKIKIKEKSFDVVLLLQVIEHIDKKSGINLLKKTVKIAKKCIIVSVPNGCCHQAEYDGNAYQKHVSIWTTTDLRKLGYKVYGQGLRRIYGANSYGEGQVAKWWQKIIAALTALLIPVLIVYPQIAAQLIGIRYLNEKL